MDKHIPMRVWKWIIANTACRVYGHSKPWEAIWRPYVRTWIEPEDRGSVHCMRCDLMTGEYFTAHEKVSIPEEALDAMGFERSNEVSR